MKIKRIDQIEVAFLIHSARSSNWEKFSNEKEDEGIAYHLIFGMERGVVPFTI